MAKQVDKLPNKPSELIRLAIKDLSAVEKLKEYKVDMHTWHEAPNDYNYYKCQVCFGGAVMARTMKVSR